MPRMSKTLNWLYSLEGRGEIYKLERMDHALALIGDPHRRLRAVHIAGTKGKGSVAAMLDAIARAAGLRVGLYTKPHLVHLSERTRVDGAEIPARADARLYRAAARDLRTRRSRAHVFRVHRRADVPVLRRGDGRYRGDRDRAWRTARLDQRGAPLAERDHPDRFRSHGYPRPHDCCDRGREGRHHQARRAGRDRRARSRGAAGADLFSRLNATARVPDGRSRFHLSLARTRASPRLFRPGA